MPRGVKKQTRHKITPDLILQIYKESKNMSEAEKIKEEESIKIITIIYLKEIKFLFQKGFSINKYDKILKIIVTASNSILSNSLNSLPLFLAKAKTGKCHK